MYRYTGGESFDFPLPDFDDENDERPCSGIASEAKVYASRGKLGSAVDMRGHKIHFENAVGRLLSGENAGAREMTGAGDADLPTPEPYTGPRFDIFDYLSDEYAGARTLDGAIEMRGDRAFAESVEPEDFSDLPEGVERLGIASLWSQSTFSPDYGDRDFAVERLANSPRKGDLLFASPLPPEMKIERGGTWSEIDDWGFGFFTPGGVLLPFACFHDYDLNLLLEALLTLERGQVIACTVRNSTCNGADDEGADDESPGFGWRVYSCEVTVFRITL